MTVTSLNRWGNRLKSTGAPTLAKEPFKPGGLSLLLSMLLIGLWSVGPAHAENRDIVPSISLREEFNDNIFLSSDDEVDDFITTLSPGIRLYETTERWKAELLGRLDVLRYLDNDDLDTVDQNAAGRADYAFTERTSALLAAEYIRDSRPDRDVLETGLVQNTDPRKRYLFSASGSHRTGENTFDSLTYNFERSDYEDEQIVDSKIQAVNLAHTWYAGRFVENAIGRLNFGYANADFETSTVNSFSGTIGADWQFSELVTFQLNLGLRYTKTDFFSPIEAPSSPVPVFTEETLRGWNAVGDLEVAYRGEKNEGRLRFSHDVRDAQGRGGTSLRTSLDCVLSRQFTQEFRASLLTGLTINRTDQNTVALTDIDSRTLLVLPSIRYEFTRNLYLEAGYKFTLVKNVEEDRQSDQNIVFGRLYWQWPILQ